MRWFRKTESPDDVRPGVTLYRENYREPDGHEIVNDKIGNVGEQSFSVIPTYRDDIPARFRKLWLLRLLIDIPVPFWRRDFDIDYCTKLLIKGRVRAWWCVEVSNFKPRLSSRCGIHPAEPRTGDVIVPHPRLSKTTLQRPPVYHHYGQW